MSVLHLLPNIILTAATAALLWAVLAGRGHGGQQ
ncbi:MAG: hypothetical protein RLZZ200_1650 [Pseudomonadota bacterium]|jgi:hypothetical protein